MRTRENERRAGPLPRASLPPTSSSHSAEQAFDRLKDGIPAFLMEPAVPGLVAGRANP